MCRCLPPSLRPSPVKRRVGVRISTFEACSSFTRVTARWLAQPPKAAFVTRLRSRQSPSKTARQLPGLSTTPCVEPSSTGDARPRGARFTVTHDISSFRSPRPEPAAPAPRPAAIVIDCLEAIMRDGRSGTTNRSTRAMEVPEQAIAARLVARDGKNASVTVMPSVTVKRAPRGRASPVEEGSTQGVVDSPGS